MSGPWSRLAGSLWLRTGERRLPRLSIRLIIYLSVVGAFLLLPVMISSVLRFVAAGIEASFLERITQSVHLATLSQIQIGAQWTEQVGREVISLEDESIPERLITLHTRFNELGKDSGLAVTGIAHLSNQGRPPHIVGVMPSPISSGEAPHRSLALLENYQVLYTLPLGDGEQVRLLLALPTRYYEGLGEIVRLRIVPAIRGEALGKGEERYVAAGGGRGRLTRAQLRDPVPNWNAILVTEAESAPGELFQRLIHEERIPILFYSLVAGLILALFIDLLLVNPMREVTRQLTTRGEVEPHLVEVTSPVAEVSQLTWGINRHILQEKRLEEEKVELARQLEALRRESERMREEMEERIHQYEERLHLIQERERRVNEALMAGPVPFIRFATDGVVLEANGAFARLVGLSSEEIHDLSINRLLTLERKPHVPLTVECTSRRQGLVAVRLTEREPGGGESVTYRLYFLGVLGEGGRLTHVDGFVIPDIPLGRELGQQAAVPSGVLDILPLPYLMVDGKGRVIRSNRAFREMVLGEKVVHGETELSEMVGGKERLADLMGRLRSKVGLVELPLRLRQGELERLVSFVRSVEAEEGGECYELFVLPETLELRDNELILSFLSRLPLPVMVVRVDGSIAFISPPAASLLGLVGSEPKHLNEIIPTLLEEVELEEVGFEARRLEVPYRRGGEQRERYLEVVLRRVETGLSEEAILLFLREVTERVRLEQEREELIHDYQRFVDIMPLGYVRVSSRGRVLEVNRFAVEKTGWSREQVIAREVEFMFADPDTPRGLVRDTLQRGMLTGRTGKLRTSQGSDLPVVISTRIYPPALERYREPVVEFFFRIEAR